MSNALIFRVAVESSLVKASRLTGFEATSGETHRAYELSRFCSRRNFQRELNGFVMKLVFGKQAEQHEPDRDKILRR